MNWISRGSIHRAGTQSMALAVLLATMGCKGEERGPTLAGGREITSWLGDLHNSKPEVRRQAVLKLGNVGDSDPSVRRDAVLAVAKLKKPSDAVIAQLKAMHPSDRDPLIRD
jgi:hypothetical protein